MLNLKFLAIISLFCFPSILSAQDTSQQQATEYYLGKIRSKPNDLSLHRDLMETYKDKGFIYIPVSIYKNSVERNPKNPNVLYLLGYSYLLAYNDPSIENSSEILPNAENNLQAALKEKPIFPDAIAALGDYYLMAGRPELALNKWEEAIRMDEKSEPAHLSLARFYGSQKKYDKSIEEYQKSIYLKPQGIGKRYLELGSVYLDMGNMDKAEEALLRAKRFDSSLAMVYYKLGQVYAKRGMRDKATEFYRTGRKYDPNNAEVAYQLAMIFLDTNDIKYALLSVERALAVDAIDPKTSEELISRIESSTAEAANYISDLANFEYKDNFGLHYFLGKLYLKMNNKDKALKHFKLTVELAPSNADVRYQLGLLQEETEPEAAKEQYQKAVELGVSVNVNPEEEAELLFKTALTYLEEGNEGKFIQTANRGLELNPNKAEIHLKLAQIFTTRADIYKNNGNKEEENKNLDEAVKHYEQVAELQPDPEKWLGLGMLYERQNKVKAIRAYEKVIQLDPDSALAYYHIGNFRLNFKVGKSNVLMYKPQVAVEDLKKAIELDPKLADAHFALGMAYHQMDMPEEATAEFEKTVELDPKNVKAHIYLAQDYVLAEDYQKVIEHLAKAIELDDTNPDILRDFASMQLKYGDDSGIEIAKKALEKAYKLKPDDPDILNNYGYTLYLDRMFNEAIDKLKKALEIQPDYLEANYNLALAYNGVKNYDMALKYWERVIELSPQSDLAAKSSEYAQKIKKSK